MNPIVKQVYAHQGVSFSKLSNVERNMIPQKLSRHFRTYAMQTLEQELEQRRILKRIRYVAPGLIVSKEHRKWKNMKSNKTCWENNKSIQNTLIAHARKLKRAKEDAKKLLLTLRLIREQDDCYIPDEDRAILNEAIHAKLDLKYMTYSFRTTQELANLEDAWIISNTQFTPLVLYVVKQSLLS